MSKRAKKLPKWFKCPCCTKRTAFDAEEMEIDTFACTMFAHVKANGGLIAQSSAETLVETDSNKSSEYFLEQGSARRTEFYYQHYPTQTSEDVEFLQPFVQCRLRPRRGPSRRDKIVMAALSDGKDTEEIKAVLDQEDAMASTEEFILHGASRRCFKSSLVHFDDPSCIEQRPAASLEEITDGAWKCGCGVINSSKRKRCRAPCYKWRPGLRTGGKKFDNDDDIYDIEGTNEADARGDEDRWECPSCKQVGPFGMKLCNCSTPRRVRRCAIQECPGYSQGSQYNYMCTDHYLKSTIEENVPSDDEEVDDQSEDDDLQDIGADIEAEDEDRSENEDSQGIVTDIEAVIEADTSTTEDFVRIQCESCKRANPLGKNMCGCSAARRRRLCAVSDCPVRSEGTRYNHMCGYHYAEKSSGGTAVWTCRGCGKIHASRIKRCPQPCLNWKNGQRLRAIEKNVLSDEEEFDDKSGDDDLQDMEADIEANMSADDDLGRWKCPSCEKISPFGEKQCDCGPVRRNRVCAVPDCFKHAQGVQYNYMCKAHYRKSTTDKVAATPHNPRRQITNASQQSSSTVILRAPDIEFEQISNGNTRSHSRKRKIRYDDDLEDAEADIEANTDEDFARWRCQSCNRVSRFGENPCNCSAKRRRLCAVPDCSKQSKGLRYNHMCGRHYRHHTSNKAQKSGERGNNEGTVQRKNHFATAEGNNSWKCHGCGKIHPLDKKRCPQPCFAWKNGCRMWGSNVSSTQRCSTVVDNNEVPGRRKNPYADRKRRELTRKRSRHHCGSCDACMVDDCGECRSCLDKPRFGGPFVRKSKCMNLPPCYNPPGTSRTLDSDFAGAIERNVSSDEEEVSDEREDEDEDKDEDEDEDEDEDTLFEALTPGKYEYVPIPAGSTKFVQNGDILVTLFTTGWERGKVEDIAGKATPSQKRVARGFSVPRLVRYVSDWSYWLHDLDNPAIYLSKSQFKNLIAGKTEASEGVKVGAWCVVRRDDSQRKPSYGTLV